ncbi:hypothetical protein QCB45_11220 [Thiomicrorhabdus sp. ZW0627]|uniref:hypothetical protein n=1 Tax=Thiomicrorhabdus sp. ZW0627 TaxID=3039774 RepID=UPI002436B9EE|nr:hypothetical protein [Thiomicrorhabdus sp. ZW0627]MDG6774905.1 hypothetical protein [Thiomicrorhabdus sp. ZW0627]
MTRLQRNLTQAAKLRLRQKWLEKQRGVVTVLGIASIVVSLFAFQQVMEFGNMKLLDRKLDNYAKTVASVALRSELAITKEGMDAGTIPVDQTDQVVDSLLTKVGMYIQASDSNAVNLYKKITFGNFDADGNFVALTSDASNPKAADPVPDFSAVAVQLWSSDSFYGFTPQGKALYGLSKTDQDSDSDCYCKNRYNSCVSAEISTTDLSMLPTGDADAISVANSAARKSYCRYGWTATLAAKTKYPYAEFNNPWIGKPLDSSNMFSFFSTSYSDSAVFNDVLSQKPVSVVDGVDELNQSSSMCFCMPSGGRTIYGDNNSSTAMVYDDAYLSDRSQYRCEKSFSSAGQSCSDASGGGWFSPKEKVYFSDAVYVGYEGTCIAGTSGASVSSCLSYDDSGTTRYESCLDIVRREATSMNFFERMIAFFFGPWLDWGKSYEGLNCEMKKMKYVGWFFWGGWVDV